MDATTSVAIRRESAITIAEVIAACVVIEAGLFAWFGIVNRDEGWYLNAGRLVFEGKVPYRDFNYFQSPVLPYLYGGPQWLFGPSLLLGRVTSVAFLLGAVVALVRSARLLGGAGAATWTLALLAVNPSLLYYGSLARSESATLMFSALALWCFLRYRRGMAALLLAPACLVLAVGVREPLVPAALAAIAYIWWRTPASTGQRVLAGALLPGELAAIAVPAMLAGRHVIFNLWSSQVHRASEWSPTDAVPWSIQTRIEWVYGVWTEFALLIVPVVVICAVAAAQFGRGWRPQWRRSDDDPLTRYLIVSAFALLMFIPFVIAVPFEARYFVPTSGLLAAVVGSALSNAGWRASGAVTGRFVAFVMVAVAIIIAPFYIEHAQAFTVPRSPSAQLQGATDVISRNMGPEDEMLTFDPLLTLNAGVRVTPGLEMGPFSYWPRMSTASAVEHGVFNKEMLLREITSGQPKVVALTDFDLTFFIGSTLQYQITSPTAFLQRPLIVLPQLASAYRIERTIGGYGQLHENLYILVRNR